jgi:glycosyltransferase involved in cell wall biosynthesis
MSDFGIWHNSFKKKHGRPLRILHIGNIANNAYNNAKLLIKAGVDSDVICYDYYHIMGCPEWEDADFEGEINDQFYPVWGALNLNGFERPRWFAQGPLELCIKYLIAKHAGDSMKESLYWNILCYENKTVSLKIPELDAGKQIISLKFSSFIRRLKHILCAEDIPGWINNKVLLLDIPFYPLRKIVKGFLFIILLVTLLTLKFLTLPFINRNEQDYGVSRLVKCFEKAFPDRPDKLRKEDLEGYLCFIDPWKKLFQFYDIVQAYSTDTIIPLLAGKPYFAFEHGTLRDIPFSQTPQGRLTALSYHLSEHVLVTNSDCLDNAHALAEERVTFINHPYDEDHGLNVEGWQELRDDLCSLLDAEFLFLFPTRHDWIPNTGYADKANDTFLKAFCRLRGDGYKVGMVCCRWGSNVKESINLLKKQDCDNYVHWIEPMGIVKFERTAKACHIVIDQFKLGSFGGVMFKAMAIGSPICTYLDEKVMLDKYGEVPPVINCQDENEINKKIKKIIDNQLILKELSEASRNWIKKHYNSSDTVRLQLLRYREYLENNSVA